MCVMIGMHRIWFLLPCESWGGARVGRESIWGEQQVLLTPFGGEDETGSQGT